MIKPSYNRIRILLHLCLMQKALQVPLVFFSFMRLHVNVLGFLYIFALFHLVAVSGGTGKSF